VNIGMHYAKAVLSTIPLGIECSAMARQKKEP
jgi:hypothetical protein